MSLQAFIGRNGATTGRWGSDIKINSTFNQSNFNIKSARSRLYLVLVCIDADFCNQILMFQHFSRSTVAPIGRKKGASTFLLPKKKNIWWRTTIKGALAGRRLPRRSSSGQPSVNVRSTLGQPWVNLGSMSVNLGSTLGQRWVNPR